MSTLAARIRSWWRNLLHRSALERGLAEELQAHLEHRADDLMAQGMSRGDAMRTARLEFGSVERVKEETRQSVGLQLVDEIRSDLRYALRMFSKNRAFVVTALATLSLTMGANTAVFSVVDALFLRSLPVHHPEELVVFEWLRHPEVMVAGYSGYGRPGPGGLGLRTSFPAVTFERLREQHALFTDVFAFAPSPPLSVTGFGSASPASAIYVSGNYYRGLGVPPQAGRVLMPSDEDPGAAPVAVVSDRYWRRRFGSDPAIVGQTVTVNRLPVTLVGISAPGFDGPFIGETSDITLPLSLAVPLGPTGRERPPSQWWLQLMARLQPGVRGEQALGAVQGLFAASVRESWDRRPPNTPNPSRNRIPELRLAPGAQGPASPRLDYGQVLLLGGLVVGTVLVIGCLNLANLLLVRGAARRQEIALRLTLGANRWRIVRQLMTETLLLALLGGCGGLIVGWSARGFLAWLPTPSTPTADVRMDLRALIFTGLLSIATAVIFGLGPAVRTTRGSLERQLRSGGQGGRVARSAGSRLLLVAQLALSLALLVSTGLLVRTLYNFGRVNLGFNADDLLVFRVDLGSQSREATTARHLLDRIAAAVERLPGVNAVTISAMPVVARSAWREDIKPIGGTPVENGAINLVRWNFLQTMQSPVVSGRDLSAADAEGQARVAIINETLARQMFGDSAPVGRYLTSGAERTAGAAIQVVGVSRDMRYARLDEPPPPTLFLPYAQASVMPSAMTFEVRTDSAPLALASAVRDAVRGVDPMLPITAMRSERQQIGETIGAPRAVATLTAVAGGVGLLLACIGLYGVVSYDTVQRLREIGIRIALGAGRLDVLRLVMHRTASVVVAGAAVGIGLSLVSARLLTEWLFGTAPIDPLAIGVSTAALIAAGLTAAFVPARRALGLPPTQALRCE